MPGEDVRLHQLERVAEVGRGIDVRNGGGDVEGLVHNGLRSRTRDAGADRYPPAPARRGWWWLVSARRQAPRRGASFDWRTAAWAHRFRYLRRMSFELLDSAAPEAGG